MNRYHLFSCKQFVALAFTLTVIAGLALPRPAAALQVYYLYTLADLTGSLPLTWVPLAVDDQHGEVLVADASIQGVRVFDAKGLEIFSFGDDPRLGSIRDLAPLDNGDILLLTAVKGGEVVLLRCNYRGEPQEQLAIEGLPEGWSRASLDRLVSRGGQLYLVSTAQMRVALADLRGRVTGHHDLAALVGVSTAAHGLNGFDATADGTLYFTVPTRFEAYRLRPGAALETFGQSGSTPGRFGVVAGIAADPRGRIIVVDTLRCVGIIFSPTFELITEFGYRGYGRGGLIAPRGLTLSADGQLYVTQQGTRGVRVFGYDSSAPLAGPAEEAADNQVRRPDSAPSSE